MHRNVLGSRRTIGDTGFHVRLNICPTSWTSNTPGRLAGAHLPLLPDLSPVALRVLAGHLVQLGAAHPRHLDLLYHVLGACAWVRFFTALQGTRWFWSSCLGSQGDEQVHHDWVGSIAGARSASSVSPLLVHDLGDHLASLVALLDRVRAHLWWIDAGVRWAANARCLLDDKRGRTRRWGRAVFLLAGNLGCPAAALGWQQLLPRKEDRWRNGWAVGYAF